MKHLSNFLTLSLAVCASLALPAIAKADPIVTNGTFTPSLASGSNPGYGTPAGWSTEAPNTGAVSFGGAFWSAGTFPGSDTTTVGLLQASAAASVPDAILYQTVDLTVGENYTLSFLFDGRQGYGQADFTACVAAAATACPSGGDLFEDASVAFNSTFYTESINFTATAAQENLVFSAAAPTDSTVFITDVAINPAPEPSSLMLLGTGLASACGVMYRKRRASIA